MSNFSVIIQDAANEIRFAKSKSEIRNTMPSRVWLQDNSAGRSFADKRFGGKSVMPLLQLPNDSYQIEGPDPSQPLKFYGEIVLAENGQIFVK